MTNSPSRMPALFIGHGSPMNVILKNRFTKDITKAAKALPKPNAILVISAHWLTPGSTYVGCMEKPEIIYDYYGFPPEMYTIQYPSPGSPKYAQFTTQTVKTAHVKCNADWGLDHASFTILKHMYPNADIPVFEMSLDYSPFNDWKPKTLMYHYKLASELMSLREKGVLILGSGNLVHNLSMVDFDVDAAPFDWAVEFDGQVKKSLLDRDHEALLNYEEFGEEAFLGVPTLDHYLPMIYVIALQQKREPLKFIHEGFQHGSISMRAFQIG
jgi:4,5-DOPA dioxygenase extradiol